MVTCRIVSSEFIDREHVDRPKDGFFVRVRFPMNFVTAPLIADLFLLAISAIGKEEVKGGTVGADNISPLDIMIFFITLAYIAISIDASGLIRWLAFKVLLLGGKVGHKLFFYLYAFFFGLGSFIGNDPIILSGTAFLAYMTRVSKNIRHPKAWIYSQFAVANIASAILVSSNPTNLVLAGAFEIRFIDYTANMVVPVVITAIVLFPFLLYIVFANEKLIPSSIEMHTLPDELAQKQPVNPNIPHARGHVDDQANDSDDREALEEARLSSLQEVMNPFLDRRGAAFGGVIMAATLITVLAINAASAGTSHHQVFWVTLPAAFVMFCWDLACGWLKREETRKIARESRLEFERKERAKREKRAQDERCIPMEEKNNHSEVICQDSIDMNEDLEHERCKLETAPCNRNEDLPPVPQLLVSRAGDSPVLDSIPCRQASILSPGQLEAGQSPVGEGSGSDDRREIASTSSDTIKHDQPAKHQSQSGRKERATLVSLSKKWHQSLQETFPTVVAVLWHLPFALVPFAFAMFVLVQALVTKGWVTVFAHGWDHWVNKTGTIGCIGGMGFLSVILCNVSAIDKNATSHSQDLLTHWLG